MPYEVIRANIKLAISGGINEPQHTVTNGVWALSSHPDQLDLVRERPSGFLDAFDEVVRVYPPIHLTVKKSVAHDIELGGVRVPGGSSVISFFYAGNRDPEQFENPTVFDVTRERRPGLTFGIGAHGCAGAHIAKAAVGGAAWPMLYERLGGLRAIDPEAHQQEGWVFRRLPELPVTWDEVQD